MFPPRPSYVLNNLRTMRGQGENETISVFQVHTTLSPHPYYVLHVSTRSSSRAHQAQPVSTTILQWPHEDQAVHTTSVLHFQGVLTVYLLFTHELSV